MIEVASVGEDFVVLAFMHDSTGMVTELRVPRSTLDQEEARFDLGDRVEILGRDVLVRLASEARDKPIVEEVPSTRALQTQLDHESYELRREAAITLAGRGYATDAILRELSGALHTRAPQETMWVLLALRSLGPRAAPLVPDLVRMLIALDAMREEGHDDPMLMEDTIEALAAIGDRSQAVLDALAEVGFHGTLRAWQVHSTLLG